MTRKLLTVILALMIFISAASFTVMAEVASPTTLGAPQHFGASLYYGDSIYFSFSSPEDVRAYIEKRAADDPDNNKTFSIHFQIDYKIDGGSWHHTAEWDSPKTVPGNLGDLYFTLYNDIMYIDSDRWSMGSIFPEDESLKALSDTGWDYFKSHTATFRARFTESFDGGETYVISPWSKEYALSANTKADTGKLVNHAPALISADLKKGGSGEPYFDIKTGRVPGDVQELYAMAGGTVRTEIWMRRAGDADFKLVEYEWASNEVMEIEASDYFSVDGTEQSYAAEAYEIKARYALDLREYKQSGYFESSTVSVDIYSPFSNVISHNMPSWSNASAWATAELKKADEAGLIPDILQGADMTRPITREEFAELAVKLYETTMGIAAAPASPNPFTDTKNPEILKAYNLKITTGTSATTFAPKELTNREQVATMLSRAIRGMAPGGDFSTAGAPTFSDRKDISSWALDHVLFMAKIGVIKGTDGKFMPKAVTTAQTASGYATTTREQAIAMSVRSFDQLKSDSSGIKAGSATPAPAPVSGSGTGTSAGQTALVGVWDMHVATGSPYDIHITYVFKSDGTYNYLARSTYDYSCNAYKGNYSTNGGKILFTNVSKILFTYDQPQYNSLIAEAEKAGYKPADNDEKDFSITGSDEIKIGETNFHTVKD